jgi:hypothetical protein
MSCCFVYVVQCKGHCLRKGKTQQRYTTAPSFLLPSNCSSVGVACAKASVHGAMAGGEKAFMREQHPGSPSLHPFRGTGALGSSLPSLSLPLHSLFFSGVFSFGCLSSSLFIPLPLVVRFFILFVC